MSNCVRESVAILEEEHGHAQSSKRLSMLFHEIKNWVGVAQLNSRILEVKTDQIERGGRGKCELSQTIMNIKKSLQMVLNLIDRERGQIETVKIFRNSLKKSLQNVISVVEDDFRMRGISIDMKCVDSQLEPFFDPEMFENVVLNILTNALSAIRVNSCGYVKIEVIGNSEDKNIVVNISNNGKEIESKYVDSIFEFGISTKESGNGIGLYISRCNMEKQSGSLELLKSDRECTIFQLKLLN